MPQQALQNSLISIILPAYNTPEEFLRAAIESVTAQTYDKWELLIIDDSTTAPVENIVKSYTDARIKYFRNPKNLGMANTRNRGLELAQGEFIALLDHDDVWLPEKLIKQLEIMQQKGCNMVYSPVIYWGADHGHSPVVHNVSFGDLLKGHNIISCSCVLLRAALIRNFNLEFHQQAVPADDYAMWMSIALYGGNIECTEECLVRYRKHDNNTSGAPLACYPAYDWIYINITKQLFSTQYSLKFKIQCLAAILRSRAWVLRKIASEDNNLCAFKKLRLILKAIRLNPIHPQGWRLLVKITSGGKL